MGEKLVRPRAESPAARRPFNCDLLLTHWVPRALPAHSTQSRISFRPSGSGANQSRELGRSATCVPSHSRILHLHRKSSRAGAAATTAKAGWRDRLWNHCGVPFPKPTDPPGGAPSSVPDPDRKRSVWEKWGLTQTSDAQRSTCDPISDPRVAPDPPYPHTGQDVTARFAAVSRRARGTKFAIPPITSWFKQRSPRIQHVGREPKLIVPREGSQKEPRDEDEDLE
jgi:hypothetical protein